LFKKRLLEITAAFFYATFFILHKASLEKEVEMEYIYEIKFILLNI